MLLSFAIAMVNDYYQAWREAMNDYYWEPFSPEITLPSDPLAITMAMVEDVWMNEGINPTDLLVSGMSDTQVVDGAKAVTDLGLNPSTSDLSNAYYENYPAAAELIDFFTLIEDLYAADLWSWPGVNGTLDMSDQTEGSRVTSY